MTSMKILKTAINALENKKAVDIQAIEVGDLTILTEYFLFASGTSSTHVKALADEVEFQLSQQGFEPHRIEGRATGWILIDYDTVVIHVFSKEAREFYSIERLWHDGKKIEISSLLENQEENPQA